MNELVNQLVESVIEWDKVDAEVARDGWTPANEFRWECKRHDMVSTAIKIREKLNEVSVK